ncbi:DUF1223 domain-containing protein [Xanthobacter autotrophicus]|uniref:DUF1223 domain-containing protein n=1 Tax=Xanthobacter TaxID=279 RepID=UPI0024AAB3A8|nr:DUF1223 domain-containing protein [Xanthobacter autotrophicus]MDI4666936.1 DUF1223 domain-containing protein [Xanthobacter autotrophicus]
MTFTRTTLALLLALAAGPAWAQSQPKTVVELFTSQGCASCPPADALLTELAKDPQVLALTLAVDYWDYVGWKDTLALHGHSLRQKAYAEQRPDRKVFTPQVVVDGTVSAKGSDRAALQRAVLTARSNGGLAVPVSVTRDDDAIEITLPESAAATGGADLWACPVARSQTVAIGRGENGGRSVTYSNVVRGWLRVAIWQGDARRYRVPLKELGREGADSVAVLVQTGSPNSPGPIIGAAFLPLD